MSIHGDYAASIVHDQRSRELQAEARRDSLIRLALTAAKSRTTEKARARAHRARPA
ncbi:hypothetical protein [Jiangella anatolica]|uniref:hypothetical protein n=1 Tax=Jiangella anatolica TaxID=2670374 RepID=UPI001314AF7C|nr:hypothetical protein [Jiangella anatolica]